MNYGVLGSGAYYFNKYVGAQVETGAHDLWVNSSSSNGSAFTLAGGLIARFPTADITPFVHGLVGGARVDGPEHEPFRWGPALTAGGGMDYATPLFNGHLGIRLFQADYEYMHVNWGPGVLGGRANLNSARLSAGVVIHVGSLAPPPQLTVACAVNPTSIFPGDPVTATATIGSQDPKLGVVYSISGDGITGGNSATATVNTASLSPGQHTVKCDAKEGKPGKEGLKPWQVATESTASFTVKEYEPPTISCSVSPTTIKPGDSASITATAASPQNRPLTYTYSASAGTVSGNRGIGDVLFDGGSDGIGIDHLQRGRRQGSQCLGQQQPEHPCASTATAAARAGALLDQLRDRQEASDAGGQRSQGVPGRSGTGSAAPGRCQGGGGRLLQRQGEGGAGEEAEA